MAATAKSHGNFPNVHLREAAASNHVHSVFHAGQGKDDIQVLDIPQLVYQEGEISYVGIARHTGDSHVNTIYDAMGDPFNHVI